MSNHFKLFTRTAGLFLGGMGLAAAGVGAFYVMWPEKAPRNRFEREGTFAPQQFLEIYDRVAEIYDKEVLAEERKIGASELRRRMMSYVGDSDSVLEVAAGTGRNNVLYPETANVLLTDASREMLRLLRNSTLFRKNLRVAQLDVSSEEATRQFAERARNGEFDRHAIVQDDSEREQRESPFREFDCVVSSFLLCSVANPQQALDNAVSLCRPGGRLLFLEHGRSGSAWSLVRSVLDQILDRRAVAHARQWGCWFNRDVADLLRKHPQLRVDEYQQCWFGHVHMVVATKVDPSASHSASRAEPVEPTKNVDNVTE
ncbi:MAG: hypothetical protein MHM6MM_004356 [Cercozoa sp. M6MM]